MMNKVRAWAAGAVVLSACGLFEDVQLEVMAGSGETPVHTAEWPLGSGETITVNNSVRDSAGLAGLEVSVFLPGGSDLVLRASDFDGRTRTYGPIAIEKDGEAHVFVRLLQHGVPAAEGSISWTPGDRARWQVIVARHAHPGYADENLNCGVLCVAIARFPIREDARNYSAESFWLIVRHLDGWEG
jgi:hypothetical protein